MKAFVYILTNKYKNVLYTGVTSNLYKRICQHKQGLYAGFTQKYNVDTLVYVEQFSSIDEAIAREKQIKSWSRKRKEDLINSVNPKWEELQIAMTLTRSEYDGGLIV